MSDINVRLHIKNPSAAFEAAFLRFMETLRAEDGVTVDHGPDAETRALWEKLDVALDTLGFSVRTQNCLKNANKMFVGDIVSMTEMQVLGMDNFGRFNLNEVKAYLAKVELRLNMETRGWRPKKTVWPVRKDED